MSTESVWYLLPELLLIAVGTLIYIGGAVLPERRCTWTGVAIAGLLAAGLALCRQYDALYWPVGAKTPELTASIGGPLVADLLGQYIRWLTLLVGLLFVMLSARSGKGVPAAEFLGTLVMATAGVMLVSSARDLVLMFMGLELLSIPTYVLLYLGRNDAAAQESTVKYFYLSILSSALLLYGFSFLYGLCGSTDLTSLRTVMALGGEQLADSRLFARVALVLVFAGLGFRITAVPFHFYAPDVYQGTTNGNAGLLAVFPKIAGFVALVRIVAIAMPGMEPFGWRVALILAVLTMTVGNLLALWQDNIRRLMAYSSIAHGGYMLIGLAAAFGATSAGGQISVDGIAALLFYLAVYVIATTGVFAALVYLGQPDRQVDGVDELAGLGRTHPWAGLAMAVFMFSLAGIPPLAGFWGKLTLFASALGVDGSKMGASPLRPWFISLAVIGALNAAVAAAYYLRVVGLVYFRQPAAQLKAQGGRGAYAAMLISAVLVVLLGCYPAPLVDGSNAASESARIDAAHPAAKGVAAADRRVGTAHQLGALNMAGNSVPAVSAP